MYIHRIALYLALGSTILFSAEKIDPDLPNPQQEKALSQYLEAVASTGVKGTSIALQVVDQLGKPIDHILVQSSISAWKSNPLGTIRFNSPAFTSEQGSGSTNINGIFSVTSPERWFNMSLFVNPDYLDQRVIYKRDNQDSNFTPDILTVTSGDIDSFKKGTYSVKPVYSKKITVYRTTGPEQLLLDTRFLCHTSQVQPDRTYPAIAADFIRRGSVAEPRLLRTLTDIDAADEDMILRFGEVADPKAIRGGVNSTGGWDPGTPYKIWLELECRRGGLRIADEPYPYLAPLDGYSRKLRFELTANDITGGQISGLVWIRRTGTPVRYGILQFSIHHNREPRGEEKDDEIIPTTKLWLNPSGSRNLERPGPGQFDPHFTSNGKSVMLWRPQPMLLRPDNNLEREFSEPYTDITQSYGPQWFAEPRQAGAIRLLDDPPEVKKP